MPLWSQERRHSASDVKLGDKFETDKIIAMCVAVREWCAHSHPIENGWGAGEGNLFGSN